MSLISLVRIEAGQVHVLPGSVKMVSTDNLATITAAGYLNRVGNVLLPSIALAPNDVIECLYSYNSVTRVGTYILLSVSIANGVITLASEEPGVVLPVVAGHFANFSGTAGLIADLGYLPSDATKTRVVMQSAASVVNNIPKYADVNGTIVDSAVALPALQLKANILANTVAWAGGGTSHAFTITGLTTSSIVIPSIQAQGTGTVYIESFAVTANTLTVTFSADPGAVVLHYVAFIAAQ